MLSPLSVMSTIITKTEEEIKSLLQKTVKNFKNGGIVL